ncbi:MAG TPA: hypothetical protein VF147_07520, partial [Vicinamibacterales bacterium]
GFVDVLPVFALGLAAFYTWAAADRARRTVVTVVVLCCVSLSIFQMLQYWNGVLPFSDLTWDQYRGLFLRMR